MKTVFFFLEEASEMCLDVIQLYSAFLQTHYVHSDTHAVIHAFLRLACHFCNHTCTYSLYITPYSWTSTVPDVRVSKRMHHWPQYTGHENNMGTEKQRHYPTGKGTMYWTVMKCALPV